MPLTIGHLLQGRYRILELLGQGGMGAVYLAEDTHQSGRRCAVKENTPDPCASQSLLAQAHQQFLSEAKVLDQLDHSNLPKISDYLREGDGDYLVMDYVEGEDLDSALQRIGGPLPEKPVLIWIDQVLDALTYLHSHRPRPIIHRDIKPANIRLTPQGKIKLVDFGLAKLLDPNNPRTKTVLRGRGTLEYAPQEQYPANGTGHTDARSDLYSLGATLYHLLTNTPPPDVYQRLLNPGVLRLPRQLNPQLTENTERAILRALEIRPDQRFQSAAEMRQALQPHVDFPAVTQASPPPKAEKVAVPVAFAEQAPPPAVPRMRCPHCGQMMIPATEKLCFRCGRPLSVAIPQPPTAEAPPTAAHIL
jgi:serine/threonine protein kinase